MVAPMLMLYLNRYAHNLCMNNESTNQPTKQTVWGVHPTPNLIGCTLFPNLLDNRYGSHRPSIAIKSYDFKLRCSYRKKHFINKKLSKELKYSIMFQLSIRTLELNIS